MAVTISSAGGSKPILRRAGALARRWMRERIEGARWRIEGRPALAPPHIKRSRLLRHLKANGLRAFVETGTLYGDTLAYLRPWCDELHSVELSQEFYERAKARFAGDSKIQIWHGDSGVILPDVLALITQPALFWLDGHYSGEGTARGPTDTPILRELDHISHHQLAGRHLIVVDDARCFGREKGYPSIAELEAFAISIGFRHCEQESDSLLIH